MAQTPRWEAQGNDAVADNHYRRKHRVAGQGACGSPAGTHHRDDDCHLDGRDCQCQHKRPERCLPMGQDLFGDLIQAEPVGKKVVLIFMFY